MRTPKDTRKHQTFLVRAWLEQSDDNTNLWRFRVQNVRTAEWHSFTTIMSLFNYFQTCMEDKTQDENENQSNVD